MYLIMDDSYRFIDTHSRWTADRDAAKQFRTENAAKVWHACEHRIESELYAVKLGIEALPSSPSEGAAEGRYKAALEAIASINYDNLSYSAEDAECMRQIAVTALSPSGEHKG